MDTTYVDLQGPPVAASWLNDVNNLVYRVLGAGGNAPTSPADVRNALGLSTTVNVKSLGALGNGISDDTFAIQAAVAATPKGGTVFFPPGKYRLTDTIRLPRPINVVGSGQGQILEGQDTLDSGSYVFQTNTSKMAFMGVAGLENYAFAAPGVCGIHFVDICVQGTSGSALIPACFGVDTTVNGGDFHIRGNSTTRCNFRYAVDAVKFVGIEYLNNFFDTNFLLSTRGFTASRGSASDSGGQTRFFGCLFDFCSVAGASLNEDTVNGMFAFFGCTFADSAGKGISTNDEVSLVCIGNNFESLGTAGIYVLIPATKANSNSGHIRYIVGNEGFSNGADLWFDKQSTSSADGNFSFPTVVDGNSLASTLGIKLTVPAGQPGFCCPNFRLGDTNTGGSNGSAPAISPGLFWGHDMAKRRYTRRVAFTGSYVSGTPMAMLPVGMVVSQVRILLTSNASGFTQLNLGDTGNSSRYAALNGQTQALNTWITWTNPVPDFVIDATNNQFRLIGTAGIMGASGIIEVDGFVP